jgi:hypothetical protein
MFIMNSKIHGSQRKRNDWEDSEAASTQRSYTLTSRLLPPSWAPLAESGEGAVGIGLENQRF